MFYDRFKSLCSQKGVSCNKAATEMGLSSSTPTKWKKTGAAPDSRTLSMVSAYFGVPISSLLDAPTSPREEAPSEAPAIPHEKQREILAGSGVSLLLDADAKLTEEQLKEIISFIEFQQKKHGR